MNLYTSFTFFGAYWPHHGSIPRGFHRSKQSPQSNGWRSWRAQRRPKDLGAAFLDVPGSLVSKWVSSPTEINGIYWGYNPFTNHLSWLPGTSKLENNGVSVRVLLVVACRCQIPKFVLPTSSPGASLVSWKTQVSSEYIGLIWFHPLVTSFLEAFPEIGWKTVLGNLHVVLGRQTCWIGTSHRWVKS